MSIQLGLQNERNVFEPTFRIPGHACLICAPAGGACLPDRSRFRSPGQRNLLASAFVLYPLSPLDFGEIYFLLLRQTSHGKSLDVVIGT